MTATARMTFQFGDTPDTASGPGPGDVVLSWELNNPNNNVTYVPWGMRYGTQSNQIDEPYPGDFDGDGKADFRTSSDVPLPTGRLLQHRGGLVHAAGNGQTTYDYFGWDKRSNRTRRLRWRR